MYNSLLSEAGAMGVALRFFEQKNTNVVPVDAILKDKSWIVRVTMGMSTRQTRYVKIDSNTGRIIDYV